MEKQFYNLENNKKWLYWMLIQRHQPIQLTSLKLIHRKQYNDIFHNKIWFLQDVEFKLEDLFHLLIHLQHFIQELSIRQEWHE